MKKTIAAISLLTAFALLLSLLPLLAACSGGTGGKGDDVTTVSDSTADTRPESETAETEIKSDLPELDFDGYTATFLIRGVDGIIRNEIRMEEESGDILGDAVYNRNRRVEEQLNVKFAYIEKGNAGAADMPAEVQNSILAGDAEYDVIVWGQSKALKVVGTHIYLNLYGDKYLDIEKPWWNAGYTRSMMPGGKNMYFVVGDICLLMIARMSAMFFNTTQYSGLHGSPGKLYDMVRGGGWTLDVLTGYASEFYSDLNGDGAVNDGDRYGISVTNIAVADHFSFTAGLRTTSVDKDGVPYLDMNTETAAKIYEKLNNLYYHTEGTIVGDDNYLLQSVPRFASGSISFLPYWFETADYLRDMEDDYGIVPYPKLDETQDEYRALVQNSSTVFCLPATCARPDISTAMLEAMCYENHCSVLAAYYEYTLKDKYSRDPDTVEMIELIHDSVITDFGYAYAGVLDNLGVIGRIILKSPDIGFASTWAAMEPAVKVKLEEFIADY